MVDATSIRVDDKPVNPTDSLAVRVNDLEAVEADRRVLTSAASR